MTPQGIGILLAVFGFFIAPLGGLLLDAPYRPYGSVALLIGFVGVVLIIFGGVTP